MNVKEARTQIRAQEWVSLIKDRNASGMTIKEWCNAKGVSESQYYYWLRRVRQIACTALETQPSLLPDRHEDLPVFAEVQVLQDQPTASVSSGILIQTQGADIHIGNDVHIEQLTAVMKVIAHAE